MIEIVTFVIDQIRGILRTFGLTLYYVFRGHTSWAAVWDQMFQVGNRSVFFVIVTLGFLGAILNFQTGFQAMRLFGDTSLLGAATLPLLVRQLGPTLCGLMVAIRVGTGIAAEIGSMVVTEQVDALRMCNAQPVDYLIKPRFLACTVMVPVLWVIGTTSAYICGMYVTQFSFHTNPATYMNFDLIRLPDVLEGAFKAFVFGMVIPVIAGHSGFAARGGSEGVGWATTQAVVNASLSVIMLDFALGGLAFVLFRSGGGG